MSQAVGVERGDSGESESTTSCPSWWSLHPTKPHSLEGQTVSRGNLGSSTHQTARAGRSVDGAGEMTRSIDVK